MRNPKTDRYNITVYLQIRAYTKNKSFVLSTHSVSMYPGSVSFQLEKNEENEKKYYLVSIF